MSQEYLLLLPDKLNDWSTRTHFMVLCWKLDPALPLKKGYFNREFYLIWVERKGKKGVHS